MNLYASPSSFDLVSSLSLVMNHWILFIKNYLTIKLDRIVEQWWLIVTNARGRQWTKD